MRKLNSCVQNNSCKKVNLSLEKTLWTDDLVEDVFADVRVDGAQRVVQNVDVGVLVDGSRQTYTLLLTTAQIDTLMLIAK